MMTIPDDQSRNPCSDNGVGTGYLKWIYILYYAIITPKVNYRGGRKTWTYVKNEIVLTCCPFFV
jgi:hypothetical protein